LAGLAAARSSHVMPMPSGGGTKDPQKSLFVRIG
jgi:hypothetical protein